jgi:uncharacterized protein
MEAGASREPMRGETAAERAAIAAPATADPGPLGLAAFALTTFVLSMINADLVGGASTPIVLSLALTYGGIAQILAGMWEFRAGNTFGATAFTSFGAFWISFWAFEQFFAKDVPKTHLGSTVGLYLIAWGIFTAYMWVASLRTTAAISLVFILLTATFIILGIGQANASANTIKIGGWVGIATAAAAWYASFAAVVNSTFGRTIMPVIPLRRDAGAAARERRRVATREPVAH